MIAQTPTETTANIIYPDSDGLPMSDNTKQFRWIVTIKENLELVYVQNPDVYDPDRVDFAGWLRSGDRLESIEEPTNWTSPLLGIRFKLEASELEIDRPDGQPFLSFVDLDLRRQAAEQRAKTAEQRAETAEQRAETAEQRAETAEQRADDIQQQAARLAAKLRELGTDPENI